jgi:hypothetical protein
MHYLRFSRLGLYCGIVLAICDVAAADPGAQPSPAPAPQVTAEEAARQADLEAGLSKMLTGATLEGSFTSTAEGKDPTKLAREKYTLGEVKKLKGDLWLIPARIEYGEHDVTLPLMFPIRWADDTPVIVVDNVGLPGFGAVSARVMFFADHYAGYWKHGKSGGHLFGVIRRADVNVKQPAASGSSEKDSSPSGNLPAGEQQQQNPGQ